MTALWVEFRCPQHGLERFKIKIIRKHNVTPNLIKPKFRTRPKHELSGIIVGRKVEPTEARDFLIKYFRQTGLMENVLSIKVQV